METWGVGLDPSLQGAIISSLATFLAACMGFAAIVWQIGRQARVAIDQQRQSERMKLQLRIYEDVVKLIDHAVNVEVRLGTFVQTLPFKLRNARNQRERGLILPPPPERFLPLQDLQTATTLAAVGVISTVERWEIVDARLSVFRTAINVASHDLSTAYIPYSNLVMRLLPVDHTDTGKPLPWSPPSEDEVQELERLGRSVTRALGRIQSWIGDFRTETQIALLGDLFADRPERRKPMDPYFRTIRLDAHAELEEFFENETAWGDMKREAEDRVEREMAEPSAS